MVPILSDTVVIVIHQNDDSCLDVRISTVGENSRTLFDECFSGPISITAALAKVLSVIARLDQGETLQDGTIDW